MAEKMGTPSCIAELKPTRMRSEDNRHETTKNAEHFSLMITITNKTDFDSQNPGKYNQQPRYGNQNNQ